MNFDRALLMKNGAIAVIARDIFGKTLRLLTILLNEYTAEIIQPELPL